MGCIDTELVVQLKGRVACEINSGDELIATECLFDNQLVTLLLLRLWHCYLLSFFNRKMQANLS